MRTCRSPMAICLPELAAGLHKWELDALLKGNCMGCCSYCVPYVFNDMVKKHMKWTTYQSSDELGQIEQLTIHIDCHIWCIFLFFFEPSSLVNSFVHTFFHLIEKQKNTGRGFPYGFGQKKVYCNINWCHYPICILNQLNACKNKTA